MKRALIISLIAVFSIMGILTGCGPTRTQTYDFNDFTRVVVGYAFQVEVTQSASYSVSITASEDVFNNLKVSQEGDTLTIRLTKSISFGTRKIEVSMPNIRGISLSGAAKGSIKGFNSSDDCTIHLSGASRLNGDLAAGTVEFGLSGASTVELDGSAQDIDADVSGASLIKLADFSIINADVTLSGASNGTINVSGKLDADLSGASGLSYIGEPTMGAVNITGGSRISQK